MFSKSTITRLTAVFVCVAVTAILATGTAAADEIEVNETSIEIDDQTTYADEIDEDTRLVDWEYNDDREGFELVFETDSRTSITLTEAVQFEEGAGGGRIFQQRLPAGTSEVFVSVPRRGGEAAVTMTTPGSINNNRFSYVSTGEARPDRPPISYERAQILVVLTGIGAATMSITILKRRRDDEDRTAERIL